MSKTFWAIIVVLILGLFSFLVINNKNKKTPTVEGDNTKIQASDHVLGSKDAKVVVIEYGDYQCPSCGVWQPKVEELETKTGQDFAFVFRNFPITTAHKNATAAARAAEAASKQDKFWEMNKLLYANQNSWAASDQPEDVFNKYAGELNLNVDQFKTDYEGSGVLDKINFDRDLAVKQGVEGTPTFFLNGTKLEGINPSNQDNDLIKKVDEALAQQQ